MFSCEYCEVFKNNFSYRTPAVAASVTQKVQARYFEQLIRIYFFSFFLYLKLLFNRADKYRKIMLIFIKKEHFQKDTSRHMYNLYKKINCIINIWYQGLRSSHPAVFCKKGVLRYFTKFTGKHLCQSLYFNKVAGMRPAALLNKRFWLMCFPVNFCEISKNTFFIEHLWWLLKVSLNLKWFSKNCTILHVLLHLRVLTYCSSLSKPSL